MNTCNTTECALGHVHDKQLAILPMLTVYELFFFQLSRPKRKTTKKADVPKKIKQAKLPYFSQLQLEPNLLCKYVTLHVVEVCRGIRSI